MSDTPGDLVTRFIGLLSARDLDGAAALVSEDFEYDNVPMGVARGPRALQDTLAGFFSLCTGVDWEILRQVSTGDLVRGTVLNERDDRIEIHGRRASLPVAGVFEVRDGLIILWRDYFDKETLLAAMAPPAP
jgi:limonene-1,2-epoxide hydrolase